MKITSCLTARAVLLTLALLGLWPVQADVLADIQRRGVLVVGVAQDAPSWGQRDGRTGQLVGLEPDLAADLARRLGVRLELVGLFSAQRLDAIEHRRVDLLIASLTDTVQRRERMTLVDPPYYASGVSILAPRHFGFRDWSDLKNRRVCGQRDASYNRIVTVSWDIDIVALHDNRLATAAVIDGRCDALLDDEVHLLALLQDPLWSARFAMPLPARFIQPWAIALHRSEAGQRLHLAVSETVQAWHRSGLILELAKKWGIPPSEFSRRMHAKARGSGAGP